MSKYGYQGKRSWAGWFFVYLQHRDEGGKPRIGFLKDSN